MNYKKDFALLIDTTTKESVDITEKCKLSTEFYWTEGNMSCDCNRAIEFGIHNYLCGDTRFILETSLDFPWKEPVDA